MDLEQKKIIKETKKAAKAQQVAKTPINVIDNTNQLSAPEKQCMQLKYWFFTWNNYEEDSIKILETKFNTICQKYIFEKKVGSQTEIPYLQGCIVLNKKMRWSEFNLSKKINWNKTKNETKSALYYSKDYLSKNTENIYQNGYDDFLNKKQIKTYEEIFFESESWIPTTWINFIIDLVKNPSEFLSRGEINRKIFWFWSERDKMDKICIIRYLCLFHECKWINSTKDIMNLVANAKRHDVENNRHVCIFHIKKDQKNIAWSLMEQIKDGMIRNMKSHNAKL